MASSGDDSLKRAAAVTAGALIALAAALAAAMTLPHPHKTAELFPLALGAEWVFAVRAASAPPREETWKVVRRCGADAVVARGGVETTLRVTPTAVTGPSGAPWIADPVSAGKTWTPRPGVTVRITASYVTAKVPAGKYEGCATVTRTELDPDAHSGEEVATTLCPAVGPVRIITQPLAEKAPDPPPVVLELQSFTAGEGASPGCTEVTPATAAPKAGWKSSAPVPPKSAAPAPVAKSAAPKSAAPASTPPKSAAPASAPPKSAAPASTPPKSASPVGKTAAPKTTAPAAR